MSDFFKIAPEPDSLLARHRILSPSAGVKVSPLCLGAMNFGEAHKSFLGECTKDTAMEVLDYFREKGGNFIDTANNYQDQESEQWLGEWMASRKCRDEMVIATKFTTYYRKKQALEKEARSTFYGNSTKSLRNSIKSSLQNLQTDYIDLLYVHWWDFSTSIEEVMQSLNREVAAGRVLYLGISDTPAWVVAKANQYAKDHGLRQFSVYQGLWNCATRDMEREIIPVCLEDGMAICPWRALGGGAFKTEAQRASGEGRKVMGASPSEEKMIKTLESMAEKRSTKMTSIALAYVMAAAPDVYPIVGTRKLEHLKDAIDALSIRLTSEEVEELRSATDFDAGFPFSHMIPGQSPIDVAPKHHVGIRSNDHIDVPSKRQPAFAPSAK